MQSIPVPPKAKEMPVFGKLTPEELAALDASESSSAPPVVPPPPDTRNRLQKGMDWLAGKVDQVGTLAQGAVVKHPSIAMQVPGAALGAFTAPAQTAGMLRAVAHPQEHAPELAATAASLIPGGGPLAMAGKALIGSLAGSAIKEAPKVMNGEESGVSAGLNTAKDALINSVGFAVAQKLMGGAMRPKPGSREEQLLNVIKRLRERPENANALNISATTITGTPGTRAAEMTGEFTMGGKHIADVQNASATQAISDEARRLVTTSHGPVPPAPHTGNKVKAALEADRAAQIGAVESERAATLASIDAEKAAELARIDARLAQARKDFPDDLEPPPGWSKNQTPPKPNPRYVAAEKEAADARKAVEILTKERTSAVPSLTEKEILSPDDYRIINRVVKADPETIVNLAKRTKPTVVKKIAEVLKNDPAAREAFKDQWVDTHILRNAKGDIDVRRLASRIDQADKAGTLGAILTDKKMVENLRMLAEIGERLHPPVGSIMMKIRGARIPGEVLAGLIGVASGASVQRAAASVAGAEVVGTGLVAVLRSPTTTKLLTEGLMDSNAARGAITIARAIRIANNANTNAKKDQK